MSYKWIFDFLLPQSTFVSTVFCHKRRFRLPFSLWIDMTNNDKIQTPLENDVTKTFQFLYGLWCSTSHFIQNQANSFPLFSWTNVALLYCWYSSWTFFYLKFFPIFVFFTSFNLYFNSTMRKLGTHTIGLTRVNINNGRSFYSKFDLFLSVKITIFICFVYK